MKLVAACLGLATAVALAAVAAVVTKGRGAEPSAAADVSAPDSDPDPIPGDSPNAAPYGPFAEADLPAIIQTARGPMLLEQQYIPGVVDCELAHFTQSPAALEAQAIAARTYLARAFVKHGPDFRVPIGPKFQCWRRPKHLRSAIAAQRTAGRIARWRGHAINGNYVAGVPALDGECHPADDPVAFGYPHMTWAAMHDAWLNARTVHRLLPAGSVLTKLTRRRYRGPAYTQIFVTYNAGRSGLSVQETKLGNFGAPNRGALSQHGAICLAERQGLDAAGILRFFYGEDLEL